MKDNIKNMVQNVSIAIVGMGSLFPKASGLKEYWRLIFQGEDAITEVPDSHWSAGDYFNEDPSKPDHIYCKRGGFLSPVPFDPSEFGIPPNLLEATDTSQLLSLVAAKMALNDAGYGEGFKPFDNENTSVYLGVTGTQELVIPLSSRLGHPIWRKALNKTGVSPEQTEEVIERISDSYVSWQENSFPGLLGNVVSGRICNRFNLGGTNTVVDAACASSLSAVNHSILDLAAGRSNMVITGGVDTLNDIFMHMCFAKTSVLSHSGDARPFSENADGTVLAEGIGMVALKRLDDAERDNDRIYAVIKGMGTSSDGRSGSIYAPNSAGQLKALKSAYKDADIDPETVELIEAHGTGTRVGDAVEFNALAQLHKTPTNKDYRCALGTVKSMIGHAKAAAGAAGLIKAALSLHHKVVPPTLKAENPDPKLNISQSPFYLNAKSRPWISSSEHPRRAGVSAFGFGGSNFHAVLEEYVPEKKEVSWAGTAEIIAFSSDKKSQIKKDLNEFKKLLTESVSAGDQQEDFFIYAHKSRGAFSPDHQHRLLLVVNRDDIVSDYVEKAFLTFEDDTQSSFSTPGIYYGNGLYTGKIAFMFPGQGSQYTYMGRDLVCSFPEAHDVISKAQTQFKTQALGHASPLCDYIFPLPEHVQPKTVSEENLKKTDVAQVSIGAVSLAMAKVLERFGITPDFTCGHSFGELTALCAANWINEQTFLSLAIERGKLMAKAGKDSDSGSMLAVKAPLAVIETFVNENCPKLILANRNSHDQGVLSGSTEEIIRAAKLLKEKRIKAIKLPVAAAFHSKLVDSAAKPFKNFISDVKINPTRTCVLSNTTGKAYPDNSDGVKKILGKQLASPVHFLEEIEYLNVNGVTQYIEVGPKSVLSGLAKSILKEKSCDIFSVDASAGKNSGIYDLAKAISMLAASGYPVKLGSWEESAGKAGRKKINIPVSGANTRPVVKDRPISNPMVTSPRVELKQPTRDHNSCDCHATAPKTQRIDSTPVAPVQRDKEKTAVVKDDFVKTRQTQDNGLFKDALKVVEKGLNSMHALQTQTTEAHKLFLETQSETSRALMRMIENTRFLTDSGPSHSNQVQASHAQQVDGKPTMVSEPVVSQPVPVITEQFTPPVAGPQIKVPTETAVAPVQDLQAPQNRLSNEAVSRVILEVVSNLTGYPGEMLDMDMDIESDLGIDSIKRVEILSAVEEKLPGIDNITPDQMTSLKTLEEIAAHLSISNENQSDKPGIGSKQSQKPVMEQALPIAETLLGVVSNLTGYPVEMLEPEMDLESDLGIDSIKRVEILSAFEERLPGIKSVSPDMMGELKTLQQIIDYLAAPSEGTGLEDNKTATSAAASSRDKTSTVLLEVVSSLTGYPEQMLEPEMDLESDLGIDSIKRVEILSAFEERMPDMKSVSPEIMGELKNLKQIIDYISSSTGSCEYTPPGNEAANGAANGAVNATPASNNEEVAATLIAVVSSLTGYPEEMLEPEMDMESDLGIDSIKRVEILSSFEEKMPDVKSIPAEMMGELKTLGQILNFLCDKAMPAAESHADLKQATPTPKAQKTVLQVEKKDCVSVSRQVIRVKEEPFEGINDFSYSEIAIPESYKIYITDDHKGFAKKLVKKLRSMKIDSEVMGKDPVGFIKDLPRLGGIVILPDLREKQVLSDDTFLREAFRLAREASLRLMESGKKGGAVFASVSFLDGKFGFGKGDINGPATGGIAGLIKTAAIEWPDVSCRSFDISGDFLEETVEKLALEIVSKGPVETGFIPGHRTTLELESEPLDEAKLKIDLTREDVIVVTGGAKGVTARCAQELARQCGSSIVLVGRSPEPLPEPEWLKPLSDQSEIKKAILSQEFTGKKATPADLEKSYYRHISNREIIDSLEQIKNAGANKVVYFSADVRNQQEIKTVFTKVEKTIGPITAIIHGAGVLKDRYIVDKSDEQFDMVFETKVSGLKNLLNSQGDNNLKHLVLFSSVSARMGNNGQVDYAMANEVLNKIAVSESLKRKNCRVVSINWGPWDGGMVSSALKKQFRRNNIDLIPLDAGARSMVAEMKNDNGEIEVVIGAPIVEKPEPSLETEPEQADSKFSKILELEVGSQACPILDSHCIDNKNVVPFALMGEWFSHGALLSNPGLDLYGLDDMRLLSGIKVVKDGSKTMEIWSGKNKRLGLKFETPMEIRSASGTDGSRLHARARVIMTEKYPAPPVFTRSIKKIASKPYTVDMKTAYSDILFHGKNLQGISEVTGYSEMGMAAKVATAPLPDQWIRTPHRSQWVMDPLVLDCAFQLAILWCERRTGNLCLPTYIASYRQFTAKFPKTGVTVVLIANELSPGKMTCDFTFLDGKNRVVACITGYEAVIDQSLNSAFHQEEKQSDEVKALVSREQLLEFAVGKPSIAFGDKYKIFDDEKKIARLPGPPYFFMDKITSIDHEKWKLAEGGWIEAKYEIPQDAWYFSANRTKTMPYCILLEIALQPCGWLAAYAGSALKNDNRLKFRNLGGTAVLHKNVVQGSGPLTMRCRMTKVSEAGGLIIEKFDMEILQNNSILYDGDTTFGFFTEDTLDQQVGMSKSDGCSINLSSKDLDTALKFDLEKLPPFTPEDSIPKNLPISLMPASALLMIDRIETYLPNGGAKGLGYIHGVKNVDPEEWFFKAHFHEDPVCPGSLGVESFIQLLKAVAAHRFKDLAQTHCIETVTGDEHSWIYRGQIIPSNTRIDVEAEITEITDEPEPAIHATGYLKVDDLLIYKMVNFGIRLVPVTEDNKKNSLNSARMLQKP